MYQVRVLREGHPVCRVHVPDLEKAREWAYIELRIRRAVEADLLWAALLESGSLFVDPLDKAPSLFAPDGELREGLVLDKRMLNDPGINLQLLFGLREH